MADEVIMAPQYSYAAAYTAVVQPPIEEWANYEYWWRWNRWVDYYPGMPARLKNAQTEHTHWNTSDDQVIGVSTWYVCLARVNEIIESAVYDFREAYGAAFIDAAKSNNTLVPVSALTYIDAVVLYNISLFYGMYEWSGDGATKILLSDVFCPAWKEACIYRRHIATMRRAYRGEVAEAASGGTGKGIPLYFPRTEGSARSL